MSEIVFTAITAESGNKDIVEAIYYEAFPERERVVSFEGMMQLEQKIETFNVELAYEDEQVIGFTCYIEFDEFVYLLFFAVNSELRGGGYGSRILRAFMEKFAGKAMIGCIETPIPGTSNYNQRVRRKAFYERLGIIVTEYSYGEDEEDMLTFYTSRKDSRTTGYFRSFFAFIRDIGKAYGRTSMLLHKKFYRTEDGKTIETSFSEWMKGGNNGTYKRID